MSCGRAQSGAELADIPARAARAERARLRQVALTRPTPDTRRRDRPERGHDADRDPCRVGQTVKLSQEAGRCAGRIFRRL